MSLSQAMLPAIEQELKANLNALDTEGYGDYKEMLSYHLGWTGDGAGDKTQGKRIRPLLVLLTNAAMGGDWQQAA